MKGDYCEFSHHIDVQEVASKIKSNPQQQQNTKPIRFDESEYPGLQSSSNKPKGPTIQQQQQQQPSSSTTPTLVHEDFPTLGTATKIKKPVKKAPSSSSPRPASINFAEAAKRKANVKQAAKTKKTMSSNVHDARIMQRLKQPVNIPWLVTGSSLHEEYMKQVRKGNRDG